MIEWLAVFGWGFGLGVMCAETLAWWRSRKPTPEHLVGAKLIEGGKDVLFTRSVTGSDVIIRNMTVLRIGEQHVSVTISDEEISPTKFSAVVGEVKP